MIPWQKVKILPLLIFVAALSFSLRLSEFVAGFTASPGSAYAEEAAAPPPTTPLEGAKPDTTDKPADKAAAEAAAPAAQGNSDAEAKADAPMEEHKAGDDLARPATPEKNVEWKDSLDSDLEFSEVKMELFEDLANRRKALEEREHEQVLREALLKAAEQEIGQKYKELEALKEEIQGLLQQQSEEEKKRVASLVKIYEGMKAKDAARIFDTLDMDVLLQVMSQMSERKSAPILAAMNADRARSVTIMLAEQKRLPSLADPLIPQN
jgi:flagellar motility protein MotE (MotC chaperone)